jgi:hypothetical protein
LPPTFSRSAAVFPTLRRTRTSSAPIPATHALIILTNEFALRKLDKGQYVELYYWTNKGLEDARLNYRTLDDESMVPTAGPDGSTTWITASAARPASSVIPDHSLTPTDFAHAVPRAIASLKKRGWDDNRVRMLASFWGGLMFHRYWSSPSPLEQRALLTYQDEQRRAWHQAIPLTDGAWDISILDHGEISEILDRLYREDRQRRDHDMGMYKHLFPLTHTNITLLPFPYLPLSTAPTSCLLASFYICV